MITQVITPVLPILFSAFIVPFLRRIKDFDKRVKTACALSVISCVISLTLILIPSSILWLASQFKEGISAKLVPESHLSKLYVDTLSAFFILLSFIVLLASDIYSYKILHEEDLPEVYYSLLHLTVVGLYSIFVAGDLVSLFVGWELMSVSIYALIYIRRSNVLALEAGMKYLMMSALASSLILYSISLLYGYTGTFEFSGVRSAVLNMQDLRMVWIAVTFMTVAFGFKSAIVPFHTWAPDVYQETLDPITALLSGIASKAGIYLIIRVYYTLVPSPQLRAILALLSAVTMTVGNVAALLQSDIKRLFSYSSIAHMGYVLMGLASGNPLGLIAALFHSLSHALAKPLVFLSSGCFSYSIGSRNLETLRGVGRKHELLSFSIVIGLLSLASIPGLSGFVSKFMLIASAFEANLIWLAILGILNSAVGVAYYIRVIQHLFSSRGKKVEKVIKVPTEMIIPNLILTILCIVFGLFPEPLVEYLTLVARQLSI